jgi:hypothetical protein
MIVSLINNQCQLIDSYNTCVKITSLKREQIVQYWYTLGKFIDVCVDTVYLEFSDDNHSTYYAYGTIRSDIGMTLTFIDVYLDSNIFGTFKYISNNDGTLTKSITQALNISARLDKY